MHKLKHLIAVVCFCMLGGCTFNNTIVSVPSGQSNHPVSKCWRPEDKEAAYHTAQAIVQAGVVAPLVEKVENVSGCGAVKFQLNPDGKAVNITILRDHPEGYGFGEAVADQVRRSTYQPPIKADAWFYVAIDMKPGHQ